MVSFRCGTNSFLYHTFRKDTGDESSSWSIQILDLTGRSRGKPNQRRVVIKAIFLRQIYLRVASVLPKLAFGLKT